MSTYLLFVFSVIGIRYLVYSCNIALCRTTKWKTLLAHYCSTPQRAYNEVFFSFAIQNLLAHVAFTVTGILCLAQPDKVSTPFIQALFLHHFLWDVSAFLRDKDYFAPIFLKFYWIHHILTLLVGVVWICLGVFAKLASGLSGFFVLVFLGSAITSSIGSFLRMFQKKNGTFFLLEIGLSVVQRIWRWTLIIWGLWYWRVVQPPEAEGEFFSIMVVLVSGLCMEAFDAFMHTKAIMRNLTNYRQCQRQQQQQQQDDDHNNKEGAGSLLTTTDSDSKRSTPEKMNAASINNDGNSNDENESIPMYVDKNLEGTNVDTPNSKLSVEEGNDDAGSLPTDGGRNFRSIVHGICSFDGEVELADDFLQDVDDEEDNSFSSTSSTTEDPQLQQDRLKYAFEHALQIVNSPISSKWKMTGIQKLTLYACYKQVHYGPCNTNKPNGYSMNERYKLKAWKHAGNMSKEAAMKKYIETVQIFHKDFPYEDAEYQA